MKATSQLCIPINKKFKEIKFSENEEIELKVIKIKRENFLIIKKY